MAFPTNGSLRPILGERELVVAWLAENGFLPTKNERGRYTIAEPSGRSNLTFGVKLLVVDNLAITSDEDLAEVREAVRNHARWDGDT